MIPAPPLSTAEEQHALGSLLTRRLVLLAVGCAIVVCSMVVMFTAYKAIGRTADRVDPIVVPVY